MINKTHTITLLSVLAVFSLDIHASDIYKCLDESGSVRFQDKPCPGDSGGHVPLKGESKTSTKLSESSLSGRWGISQVGDIKTPDSELEEDVWVFKGNTMEVYSGGKGLRPDKYVIEGQEIKFDYHSIKVLEFKGSSMIVKTMGIVQHLKKL